MKVMCALAAAYIVLALSAGLVDASAQVTGSLRDLMEAKRALRRDEIQMVISAVNKEMAGKTFRLSPLADDGGPERWVSMGSVGGPDFLLDKTVFGDTIVEYSRVRARTCDGKELTGQLEITYLRRNGKWSAVARETQENDPFQYFEITLQPPSGVRSETLVRAGDRLVRVFDAPLRETDQRALIIRRDHRQLLEIDVESMLPVRWQISNNGNPSDWGVSFTLDPAETVNRPSDVPVPTCVP